ncbi:hypothetical protein BJX64DRAFT_261505 [Aspergillus heterothallicus]
MSLVAGIWDLRAPSSTPSESIYEEKPHHQESAVPDNDDRSDISQGDNAQSTVKLMIRYEDQAPDDTRYSMGTGWLIKDDVIVTSGHCAFDWSQEQGKGFRRAIEVKAYIGYKDKEPIDDENVASEKVQYRHGVKVVTPEGWLKGDRYRQNDVAFIKLNQPFDNIPIFSPRTTPAAEKPFLGVVGYPGDKSDEDEAGAEYRKFMERDWRSNMMEYRIHTYGGQAGSPVIPEKNTFSISAKGDSDTKRASGNLPSEEHSPSYSKYISVFDRPLSEVAPLNGHPDVKLVEISSIQSNSIFEADGFWESMKDVIKVGAPVVSRGIGVASPFLGPIGGPLAALAGTAMGALGQLGQEYELSANTSSADGVNSFANSEKQPSAVNEAIVNEAMVQAVFHSTTIHDMSSRRTFFDRIKMRYLSFATEAQVVSETVLPVVMPALLPVSQDVVEEAPSQQDNVCVASTDALLFNEKDMLGFFDEFTRRVVKEPTGIQELPRAIDILNGALKGMNKPLDLFKGSFSVLNLQVPSTMNSELKAALSLDQEMDILGKRALLGAATASVIRETPVEVLEANGFLTAIRDAVRKIAPVVTKVAPVVLDRLHPVVRSLKDN